MCGCLSRLSLCGPVMDWRPVQGVPCLSPDDRWDRLQPPRDPTDGLDGIENGWMVCVLFYALFTEIYHHFQNVFITPCTPDLEKRFVIVYFEQKVLSSTKSYSQTPRAIRVNQLASCSRLKERHSWF